MHVKERIAVEQTGLTGNNKKDVILLSRFVCEVLKKSVSNLL